MIHNNYWWKKILLLKKFGQQNNLCDAGLIVVSANGQILLDVYDNTDPQSLIILLKEESKLRLQNAGQLVLFINQQLQVKLISNNSDSNEQTIEFLKLYLPYALLPCFSKQAEKTFSVAHLTQSLDGRIATVSGHSKWIGNEEDLIHTHCMRSLCDAVIVGSNTIRIDEPRLTVRNVEGASPVKVIIGNSRNNLSSLLQHNTSSILAFSNHSLYQNYEGVKEFIFDGEQVCPKEILKTLYREGINSVYIEGGASTISCFIKEKSIDVLQVHIANKILGSGRPLICLDEIQQVDECLTLHHTQHYKLGNEILIVSTLRA